MACTPIEDSNWEWCQVCEGEGCEECTGGRVFERKK